MFLIELERLLVRSLVDSLPIHAGTITATQLSPAVEKIPGFSEYGGSYNIKMYSPAHVALT